MSRSSLVKLVIVALAASLSACTHVAPYQRARLAHPTMTAEDPTGPATAHVYSVQEGAAGGAGGAESGCGCN